MIAQVEEQPVLKRLDDLVERWSFLSIVTGAVVAGWVTVAGLMGAVALDMFCGFDGLGRGIVIVLWGAISPGRGKGSPAVWSRSFRRLAPT
jgi:hypothetical protein